VDTICTGTFVVDFCDESQPISSKRSFGRPEKEFNDCSIRAKRYKAAVLNDKFPKEQLLMAIDKTTSAKSSNQYMPPEKALALTIDANLSKYQYETIRNALKDFDCDVLPSYYKIIDKKKDCYPENIKISETSAVINLQNLLNHTTKRIFQSKCESELN